MRKILEKLPTEGLLIIIIVLISLIILLYMTKVDSLINSNGKIVVQNIDTEENQVLFTNTDDDNFLIVNEPVIAEKETKDTPKEKRKVRLFFIKVNNDGEIITKGVLKSIYVGKTPLTKSLERLLVGPDTQDINSGLLTLIPEGSQIISTTLKDGIAYINFNELFRFNPLGVEGYIAQIKQIVYTATEYESVKSVQFLIDGSIQEYLGPEGVYIGRPITREDLE